MEITRNRGDHHDQNEEVERVEGPSEKACENGVSLVRAALGRNLGKGSHTASESVLFLMPTVIVELPSSACRRDANRLDKRKHKGLRIVRLREVRFPQLRNKGC